MRPSKANIYNKCAFCEETLNAWRAQTCAHCGKKICSHHAQIRRHRYSRVLYSVCPQCSHRSVAPPHIYNQPANRQVTPVF